MGNLIAQPDQRQILCFGFQHNVERAQVMVLGELQQIDGLEGIDKVTMLVRQLTQKLVLCHPLI